MDAFVRQLAVLSVLWSLSELLLPEGRLQKMARMTVSSYARAALSAAANQAEGYCVRLARRAGYEARAAVYLTMEGAVDHIDLWLTPGEAPLWMRRR